MKQDLVNDVAILLLKNGFTTKIINAYFDILAKKNNKVFLIKIVKDANSLTPSINNMKYLASYINATCLIIAENAGYKLEDNVVYKRHDIPTLTLKTFKYYIEGKAIFAKTDRNIATVAINKRLLKKNREDRQLSLTNLARKIGITPRMIARYESEGSEITIQHAIKLYNVLGNVFYPINITNKQELIDSYNSDISEKYHELGFHALDNNTRLFDIVAKKNDNIVLTKVGDKFDENLDYISKMLNINELFIFSRKKPRKVPALTKEEFLEYEKASDLIKFLKEFE